MNQEQIIDETAENLHIILHLGTEQIWKTKKNTVWCCVSYLVSCVYTPQFPVYFQRIDNIATFSIEALLLGVR